MPRGGCQCTLAYGQDNVLTIPMLKVGRKDKKHDLRSKNVTAQTGFLICPA